MKENNQRFRISLKMSLVAMALFCVVCFFLFAKEYAFPYHMGSSPQLVAFESVEIATDAVGKSFEEELAEGVVVEVGFLFIRTQMPNLDTPTNKVNFKLDIRGSEPRTLPAKIIDPETRVPITRSAFTEALEIAISKELGIDACKIEHLQEFPFLPEDESG